MQPQPWTFFLKIFATITLIQTLLNQHSISEASKITSFPGQPKVKFQQYSGYIAVDERQKRALFYYFVEAETDPSSKPLGLAVHLLELELSVNMDPLNQVETFSLRMIIVGIKSPAGVGFSYSANQSFYTEVNDEKTAQDNLVFLKKWFIQFPKYKNRELFITGENYAGQYVPQLAQLIVQSKAHINLKGIAIGNPLLEFDTDFNSRAEFIWSHGLISDSTYELATKGEASKEMSHYIGEYDVILDVCLSSVLARSAVLNKLEDRAKIDVCVEDETVKYLNRKDVQKAFHAELIGVRQWTGCSDVIEYDTRNLEIPTIHVLGALVKSGIRVLVYSGDQDSVLPLTGSRTLVTGLAKELKLNETVPYRAWFLKENRLLAGHRCMVTFYLMPPLKELLMKLHFHIQRDL
ncbi:Serine carboxypeptidase-like [Trema orientale]|uniref:Serine carboxypeptidase-like n=1 Tax=Trema orientale TaxID=63057 RepID=A0A2P5FRX1_TREOI|nr:Serine carboxypeptidase-like [Trema orientale]